MTLIYGQKQIQALLESSIERNRLAHAYLFSGQPGVGKDAMAIGIAMGLHCSLNTVGGCGECVSCRKTMRYENSAFRMVYPFPSKPKSMKEEKYFGLYWKTLMERVANPYIDPESDPDLHTLPIIPLGEIMDLRRELALKSHGQKHRIFLISHADRMNREASNSLLKILEEPPGGVVFFLTTSKPGRLLPTIVSRCQKVQFNTLTESDISEALKERWQLPPDQAAYFAGMSCGSLQRAIELFLNGFQEKRDAILAFLEASFSQDLEIRSAAVKILIEDREKTDVLFLLHILTILLRDILALYPDTRMTILNTDRKTRLEVLASRWPRLKAGRGMDAVGQAIDRIEKNVYLPLVIYELSRQLRKTIL
jgi:DNA polymerase-3 subunit delta'